jgi:hypothetical protein
MGGKPDLLEERTFELSPIVLHSSHSKIVLIHYSLKRLDRDEEVFEHKE